jgi:vancomycin resistance protein YoaR
MTSVTLARPRTLFLPGPPRRGLLAGLFGTLVLGILLLTGLAIGLAATFEGRILPGVQVGGVSVAGLDRTAAVARLQAQLPPIPSGMVTVVVAGTEVAVPYADIGLAYDLDAMLDAAFGIGRDGNALTDGLAHVRALAHAASLPLLTRADDAAVNQVVGQLAARFRHAPTSADVSWTAAGGFELTPATDGSRLDRVSLRSDLVAAASRRDLGPLTINVPTIPVAPAVATAEAQAAMTVARWMADTPLQMLAGDERLTIPANELAATITFERTGDAAYGPVVGEAALTSLLERYAAKLERKPTDAGFTWNAGGISGVVPGVTGRALDVPASVSSVMRALQQRAGGALGAVPSLAVMTTQPALTTEAAQAAAPKMRLLSTWTTFYVPGEGNFWGANISIPAWDLDKLVLGPGEWFNFWDDIGPITTARGYGYGGAIIGGKSVKNGALAGGICSTSTTLFNAAMRAGLEIGDKTNHYYYISRYPTGLDATVFQTDTYEVNMTFRNDTANPIVIRSYTGYGFVRFDIWGVSDGRTVALSAPITSNHRTARETTVVNTSLAPGTSRRVEYPHDGFDAVVTRWVRDPSGKLLWENTWFSHYSTVNGITEVGPSS